MGALITEETSALRGDPVRAQDAVSAGKVARSLRRVGAEICTIVLGVLIALAINQTADVWSWRQKVEASRAAMNQEIKNALLAAAEVSRLERCQTKQFDAVQTALLARDWPKAQAILKQDNMVVRRFWGDDTFSAMMASQIADHMSSDELIRYSGAFTMIRKNRQRQDDGWSTDDVLSLLAIPNLPRTAEIEALQLQALAKLRMSNDSIRGQGELLQNHARRELNLALSNDAYLKAEGRIDNIAACERTAASLAAI